MVLKNEHILLMQPRSRKFYARSFDSGETNSHPPIGLVSLAGALQGHGYKVRILDQVVERLSRLQFMTILEEFCPAIIGISVLTETFHVAEEFAATIKQKQKDCQVVFGGVFASFEYETIMRNKFVDFVVRFEGEDTFLELLEHLQYPESFACARIPGLVYRHNGKILVNPRRRKVKRLDAFPLMDPNIIDLAHYTHGGTISSGRGCGYHCIFCSSASMFGSATRARSAENLFAEVYYMHEKFRIKEFCFVDQAFTASRQRTKRFCQYVLNSNLGLKWRCLSRIDAVSEVLLKLMIRAGCTEIEYGIESGDPAVLEKIGKGITRKKITEVIEFSRALGLKVVCFFMLGHYADTINSMERTIEFALKLRNRYGVEIIPRMNTPFPGTYQYEHAAELGLQTHADDWDDFSYCEAIVSSAAFSKEDLRTLYFDFVNRIAA
jgi:radical SAM superfamily enzyme YgiQ (UPF0313 family)